MPREGRKIEIKPGEFAPGIPSSRKIKPLPRVTRVKPQEWQIATQLHKARKDHLDLRLVDPKGRAHSWALPSSKLPEPGEKFLVVPQPTHTKEYAAKKGKFLIEKGYGKGEVEGSGLAPAEIVSSRPGVLRFNTYRGRQPEEFAIVKTPKGQLIHNFTVTKETGVRGAGGHLIPRSKPRYGDRKLDSISFDNEKEIHQAKIDGAHVTFALPGPGSQVRAFSHRPGKGPTGVIEHTHKLPDFRKIRSPKGLAGTVVRGELWAAGKDGKAIPVERLGGILNASVPRSRALQEQHGRLRAAIFDVVRHKGRNIENEPYSKKLKALKDVARRVKFLDLPPIAETPKEKERLLSKIQAGELKETKEGIVSWNKDSSRPTKFKLRPDVDARVVGVFPGKRKYEGVAGGLVVKLPGKDVTTRVGTGFSDKFRGQLARNPEKFIGRVARVETQQVFPSGKLRAPSFKDFHIEKGIQ
jgi:hypothetical protein